MDIIDVDDVLVDDSFDGDTQRLHDEVEEILKQWKSCGAFPQHSSSTTSNGVIAPPATSAASNNCGSSSNSNSNSNGNGDGGTRSSFGFGGPQTTNCFTPNNRNNYGIGGNLNGTFNSDGKGAKYIDTRTFTRPKKKHDSLYNPVLETAPEQPTKLSSPLLNVQIGGPVTLSNTPNPLMNSSQMMQRSWLNDVSPPNSIMSSMDFSVNEKMGSSLITSGDFTNVSSFLNANGGDDMLGSQSTYDGYKLADVIKDRKFLENLSGLDETMTKDHAISKTDLNGIEENLSGLSTMQNSLESVTKSAEGRLSDVTMILDHRKANSTFEVTEAKDSNAPVASRDKLNSTFNRRKNFDTYRKPKSSLNSTFDALPKVDTDEPMVVDQTFDKVVDTTFGVTDAGNGTFCLNRTAKVTEGEEKQLNQTYEYCKRKTTELNQTFEGIKNETFVPNDVSPDNIGDDSFNGTFEISKNGIECGNSVDMVQSTPFVQVPRMKRVSNISQYEMNVSPIAAGPVARISDSGMRGSRNLEQDLEHHMETDDFDVEFRKLPLTPNSKTESSNGSHLLESEKRISLQQFEDFEKSFMESEQNGVDFDDMLNSLMDVRRSGDSVKLRQSLDNIKRRHSRINSEKQQEDIRKRVELTESSSSPLDNKLVDSMARSMSSSSGSERLLNRRSRYNDDVHLTLSPQNQSVSSVTPQQELESQSNEAKDVQYPLPTAPEVGNSDKKNRDRFKTIRISKRREEGMVIVPGPGEIEDCFAEPVSLVAEEEVPVSPIVETSAFSRVDYNSPKDSRVPTVGSVSNNEQIFKMPQGIPKPETKVRSLSKPRYGAQSSGYGFSRKDLSLPLTAKSSSTDNLENNRPNYQQSRLSFGGSKLSANGDSSIGGGKPQLQSNLKSPMGIKSKSYHNLYHNQVSGGSNSNLNRIPGQLGLSAQKLSHNNSNNEISGVQLRAPKAASRLGLVRPSSGYFSYSTQRKNVDSDTESINSLSSSSASSRGSLYRIDSQGSANNVQNYVNNSIEDISGSNYAVNTSGNSIGQKKPSLIEPMRTTVNAVQHKSTVGSIGSLGSTGTLAATGTALRPSGLRPPSNLRPPTARTGLPRPTSYVRR
ncbi:uncharacterized protein LOC129756498 isoform X2 [Uranotaenia lowii]|uniref:uncharacterized protein LOC129756498 isoform X2 n=1 Tax=Uranotaenia lowii TaxID=190385 RepID=UPI0024794844|nr:uncharacterized protein LOC129756498 isoform X2 [Uranotaenia lowii]